MSVNAADGSINVTVVDGTTHTGIYAADGSINVVLATGSVWVGSSHPCGAWWVTVSPGTLVSANAPDGSLYVQQSPYNSDSGLKVTAVSGSLTPGGGTPLQWYLVF